MALRHRCDETAAAVLRRRRRQVLTLALERRRSADRAAQSDSAASYPKIAKPRALSEAIVRITTEGARTRRDKRRRAIRDRRHLHARADRALLVVVNLRKRSRLQTGYRRRRQPYQSARAATFIDTDAQPTRPAARPPRRFPRISRPRFALVAIGGHTSILLMRSPTEYETLGPQRATTRWGGARQNRRVIGCPTPAAPALDGSPPSFRVGRVPSYTPHAGRISGTRSIFHSRAEDLRARHDKHCA